MSTAAIANMPAVAPRDALRQRVDEFVGVFFYGTMLKQMRSAKLTDSPYGFGGRGEEAFAGQLDMELASRLGKASHSNLGEAMWRQLRGLPQSRPVPEIDRTVAAAQKALGRYRDGKTRVETGPGALDVRL